MNELEERLTKWLQSRSWTLFPFQKKAIEAWKEGFDGLVLAPTGSGKTFSLLIPAVIFSGYEPDELPPGPLLIWVTPIKALTREIAQSMTQLLDGLNLPWEVAIRTGDVAASDRKRLLSHPPALLVTTPESLHILFGSKGHDKFFSNLQAVVVDEWHEMVGTKRGNQMELALARLRMLVPTFRIWGISATLGNLVQAAEVLLSSSPHWPNWTCVEAEQEKLYELVAVLPPENGPRLPWAGHMGLALIKEVLQLIHHHDSVLVFTNTRAQSEIWYRALLEQSPELAGQIALHHGSLSVEIRQWVEDALFNGKLKVVVCTSSLDLGVHFSPVDAVIQIGSPKGIARCIQRAGRSGHGPGRVSKLFFVPTHTLELVELGAMRKGIASREMEDQLPYIRTFDVLLQFICTMALVEGACPIALWGPVKRTHAYSSLSDEEWNWLFYFLSKGGDALAAYDDFNKLVQGEDGRYRFSSPALARKHRMSIGTIVSDQVMQVKSMKGQWLGTVEEWFISKLKPGDAFWFSGKSLELVSVKELTVLTRPGDKKNAKIPAWMGGRMPLSSRLGSALRHRLEELSHIPFTPNPEDRYLQKLVFYQKQRSILPEENDFLIEVFQSEDGYHHLFYPFEGRLVHEALGGIILYRISQIWKGTALLSFNDYGFELLTNQRLPFQATDYQAFFNDDGLSKDIQSSLNTHEMARRRFRDIAAIAGLIFKGYPGKPQKEKNLQASTRLFFDVFQQYEADNLLLRQAFQEAMEFQVEEARLRMLLARLKSKNFLIQELQEPSPLSLPLLADRFQSMQLSSETMEERLQKLMATLD